MATEIKIQSNCYIAAKNPEDSSNAKQGYIYVSISAEDMAGANIDAKEIAAIVELFVEKIKEQIINGIPDGYELTIS